MSRRKRRRKARSTREEQAPALFPEDRAGRKRRHTWFDGQRFVSPERDARPVVLIQMQRGLVPLLELRPDDVRRLRDSGRISSEDLEVWRAHGSKATGPDPGRNTFRRAT